MKLARTLLLLLLLGIWTSACSQTANRFDILITEIMADPTPPVGLPNAEYIELRNVSAAPVNLNGWRISDASGTATISANFILQPDSAVALCSNTNAALLAGFGRSLGVPSFPSLDNDGEALVLRSPQNRIIHFVNYSSSWYGNPAKADGGWSLEMIDVRNPCSGSSNWKAGTNPLGGTPGRLNSVNGNSTDDTPPQLKRTIMTDSVTAVLIFDESLDSAVAVSSGNYTINNNSVLSAICLPPLFDRVQLRLATAMLPGNVVNITANNIRDCAGNTLQNSSTSLGMPSTALPLDVVVNELLFNPRSGGYDYVEIYNRSKNVIDLNRLFLANRNNNGDLASLTRISNQPFYLFPGRYVAVTQDPVNLSIQYLVKDPDAILALSPPSMPDNNGRSIIVELNGNILDEVAYDKNWHFPLIANDDGVSLERIDPAGPSQHKDNWTSAAASAGFGTPGYQNSQFKQLNAAAATIDVTPKTFSPDQDGVDDFVLIRFKVDASGYVANVRVFDAGGRLVRYLVKNATIVQEGNWRWDGLDDRNQRLPIGTYIIHTELFNLQGKKHALKNTVILARRLN